MHTHNQNNLIRTQVTAFAFKLRKILKQANDKIFIGHDQESK